MMTDPTEGITPLPGYVWRAYRQLSGDDRGHTYLFSPSGKKIADFGGHNEAAQALVKAANTAPKLAEKLEYLIEELEFHQKFGVNVSQQRIDRAREALASWQQ